MIVGGADATRKYWTAFLQDTDLLLFIVDASDTDKLSLAASTIKELLGDARMDNVSILVVANKQVNVNELMVYTTIDIISNIFVYEIRIALML